MGTVMLKVGDMKLMTDYYQRALGLDVVAEQDGGLYLGRRQKPLVHLAPAPGLNIPARGEAGLFHTALLFEDQPSLAATVASAAQYEPQSFTGSADHLVSEAFYFNDPEGNGIELYWDRPREAWSWEGKNVVMDSLALPPQRYLRTIPHRRIRDRPARGTRPASGTSTCRWATSSPRRTSTSGTLGFEKTAGWHGQALFVSAGGYHHHMAMNVWNSRGAGPRRDTLGLGEVLIEVPSRRRRRSPRRPPEDRRGPVPPHRRRAALRGSVAQPDPRRRALRARWTDGGPVRLIRSRRPGSCAGCPPGSHRRRNKDDPMGFTEIFVSTHDEALKRAAALEGGGPRRPEALRIPDISDFEIERSATWPGPRCTPPAPTTSSPWWMWPAIPCWACRRRWSGRSRTCSATRPRGRATSWRMWPTAGPPRRTCPSGPEQATGYVQQLAELAGSVDPPARTGLYVWSS